MKGGTRKCRGLGAWLSLLALYVQVLLPMLVAVELRNAAASEPGAAASVICHIGYATSAATDDGAGGTPGSGDGRCCVGCPLCSALAAGALYMAPAETIIPLPTIWSGVLRPAIDVVAASPATALAYDARGPPLNS